MPENLARGAFLPVGSGVSDDEHSSVVNRGTGALFVFHPGYFGITLACVSFRHPFERQVRVQACG